MSYIIKNKAGAVYHIDESEYTVEQLKSKAKSNGWQILKPFSIEEVQEKVVESGGDIIECNECNSVFSRQKDLEVHKSLAHSGQEEFACDVCGESFGSKGWLTRHKNNKH